MPKKIEKAQEKKASASTELDRRQATRKQSTYSTLQPLFHTNQDLRPHQPGWKGNCHQEYVLQTGLTSKDTATPSEVQIVQVASSKRGCPTEQPSPTRASSAGPAAPSDPTVIPSNTKLLLACCSPLASKCWSQPSAKLTLCPSQPAAQLAKALQTRQKTKKH